MPDNTRPPRQWTPAEKQFIKDNAQTMSDVELALALSRATGIPVGHRAVEVQRQKLGVKKRQHGALYGPPLPPAPRPES
jgi:hypothetical protein